MKLLEEQKLKNSKEVSYAWKDGKSSSVIGPVIDIKFDSDSLPNLYSAITINMGDRELVAEVEQHVGDDIVRTIAMEATEGLKKRNGCC